MQRTGFSRKMATRYVHKEGNKEVTLNFAKSCTTIDPSQVISIDESSFYFDMKPSYGYIHKSNRLRVKAKDEENSMQSSETWFHSEFGFQANDIS
jgi:hypothetical protein